MALPTQQIDWNTRQNNLQFLHGTATYILSFSWRVKAELNEEATRYLQDFPEEMIFHTSNLHLFDSVGQGKKMCEQVCCILELFSSYSKILLTWAKNYSFWKKAGLCYTRSPTAYRVHFGQYQTSSAVLGRLHKGELLSCARKAVR